MEATVEKTNHEKLQLAWEKIPYGAKAIIFDEFGYTRQNVLDIVGNGRKDDAIILKLLEEIKIASKRVTDAVNDRNNKIQAL